MNVTVLDSHDSHSSTGMNEEIYFDTKWMPTFCVILGTEFGKLENDKLTKNNFEIALKECLIVLSECVQEKEKIEKENKKSFYIYDAKILDINTANGKPKAILDKVDKGKNVEIPFDLLFCDFIKQIKYGAVVLNKKDIRKRYNHLAMLIKKDLNLIENNYENSLTRTGNIYETYEDGRLMWNFKDENIFVQIFEIERTIKIKSETPTAIVELIEEVKNEGEKLKEMIDEDLKVKREEAIIEGTRHENLKEKKEIETEIENQHKKMFEEKRNKNGKLVKDEIKELNEKKNKIFEQIREIENKIRKLTHEGKVNKGNIFGSIKNRESRWFGRYHKNEINASTSDDGKLEEALDLLENQRYEISGKISEIQKEYYYNELNEKLDDIRKKYRNLLEQKLQKIKVENDNLLKEDIEVERKKFLEKYDDFIVELKEGWFRAVFYRIFDEVYKTEDKKKVVIKLSKEEEKQNEKGKASTSNNIETIQDDKDEYILYFDKNSLIGKNFLLKIYGKENALKLVKRKKDSEILVDINDENIADKMIEEKIKAVNLKLLEAGIKGERAKLLEKYNDFILALKEKWLIAVFYHVYDKVCKTEDKKKVVIKLSKEEEKQNEKGEASTSNNIETIQDEEEEHILYFDKNSLIGKTFLLKIYGKENAVKLVKGKKDSEILVDINDENIADKMIEGKVARCR
uniref:Uncharacterized protein n=1 Tax=Meloidogyne javanica TaxID=6303 RepID=A0A915N9W6_MELJA